MQVEQILRATGAMELQPYQTHAVGEAGAVVESTRAVNAMSVDVEDYFQVSAFEKVIDRADWDGLPCRIESNMDRILGLFRERGVRATFFTLGWLAERYPGMVRRIVDEGHELASHGWLHQRVTDLSKEEFRQDVLRTKGVLEDTGGVEVRGYRAPSYSIMDRNIWAWEVLHHTGHRYSSSIYPIKHDHYGMPDAPRFAFRPFLDGDFLEIPVTTVCLGERNLPCGGGGYFRLFPYLYSKWGIERVNANDNQSCVFYFHPWELDVDQPHQPDIDVKTRVRHYLNIGRMERRLGRLLLDFAWDRMDAIFLGTLGTRS